VNDSVGHIKALEYHFEVHPSVLFKLGEDLITDDAQALVELVKNSFDADARVVQIELDTNKYFDPISGAEVDGPLKVQNPTEGDQTETAPDEAAKDSTAPVLGRLRVTDDGVGMSTTAIRDGWLTVSASEKRKLKASKGTTRLGRTPLGDKGLGRLGAQRLGRLLFLSSVPAAPKRDMDPAQAAVGGSESFVGSLRNEALIDWDAFLEAETLSAVPIQVVSQPIAERRAGSTVEVRGLRDLAFWSNGADKALERELMSILSPYDQANGLSIRLRINGVAQDLRRNARELLSSAPINYKFDYASGELTIRGALNSSILAARRSEDLKPYQVLIAQDNGHRFVSWLIESKPKKAQELGVLPGDDKSFIRSIVTRQLDSVAMKVETADPGPFDGEASSIDFDDHADQVGSTLGSLSALRAFGREMSGVRVYRDGFGIRLDRDWLNLGDQQTSGGSWYGLRSGNTTGYVNLTAESNPLLEETTSREAFRDTPTWQGFYSLMRAWTKYAQELQEFVRRGYVEYRKLHSAQLAQVSASSSPKEIAKNVSSRLRSAAALTSTSKGALQALDAIDVSVANLRGSKNASQGTVWSDPAINSAIDEATASIARARTRATDVIIQFDGLVSEYESMQAAIVLLESQIESVEEQIARAWESVALGLSAEALTHEVEHITDGLTGRSAQIIQYLRSSENPDDRLLAFADFVRSNAGQLAVQAARMNPALRYRRERKKDYKVSELTNSTVDYYNRQWNKRGIEIKLNVPNDFTIRVNEGKFSQVLDNLLLNSEYWISRSMAQGKAKAGVISIEVNSPYVIISDSGPGIDQSVSASLFDAFVTAKPGDDGRGLGLYIVRQLLESEGGRIELSPEINSGGNFFKFRIELQSLVQL
jgi:signal transduction histidine kinase